MLAPILYEDLVGVVTRRDDARDVETGHVRLHRSLVVHGNARLLVDLYAERPERGVVRPPTGHCDDEVILPFTID